MPGLQTTRLLSNVVTGGVATEGVHAPTAPVAPPPATTLARGADVRSDAALSRSVPTNVSPVLAAPRAARVSSLGARLASPPMTRVLSLDGARGRAAVRGSLEALSGRFGLGGDSFQAVSAVEDELGIVHVRMQRVVEGMRVLGEQTIVHLRPDDRGRNRFVVQAVTGEPGDIPAPALAGADVMSAREAANLVVAALDPGSAGTRDGGVTVTETPERLVYNQGGRARIGYLVRARVPAAATRPAPGRRGRRLPPGASGERAAPRPADTTPGERYVLVDADSRALVASWSVDAHGLRGGVRAERRASAETLATPAADAGEPTRGTGRSLFSGVVELSTTEISTPNGRRYVLEDRTRGGGVFTYDAGNRDYHRQEYGWESPQQITDDDDVWGQPGDSPRQRAAIDAHYAAQTTYDALRDVLRVDSFDMRGAPIVSYVHVGDGWVDAKWNGAGNFGDGDGRDSGPLVTLDVVGHEVTHGLIASTADLVAIGEAGAICEAVADIGGLLVEWYASLRNPEVRWDWAVASQTWTPGEPNDALRYFDQPTRDNLAIDHYGYYDPTLKIRRAGGIVLNAFYQLAHTDDATKRPNSASGIAVPGGIGVEKAAMIFLRATMYYTRPMTTFAEFAQATLTSAEDLFGASSVEAAKVREAWAAVGVTPTPARTTAAQLPAA